MSMLADQVESFTGLITTSFDNAMGAVERVHQTFAEMSVDVLAELGLPADRAEQIKAKHRRIVHTFYRGIVSANDEIGALLVTQFEQVSRYAQQVNALVLGEDSPGPAASPRSAKRGNLASVTER